MPIGVTSPLGEVSVIVPTHPDAQLARHARADGDAAARGEADEVAGLNISEIDFSLVRSSARIPRRAQPVDASPRPCAENLALDDRNGHGHARNGGEIGGQIGNNW